MEAKCTPGPLVVRPNCGDGFDIGVEHTTKGGKVFIRLGGSVAHRNPISLHGRAPIENAEALANGRMWAAAAELLEALKEIEALAPATQEVCLASTMADIARAALSQLEHKEGE